MMMRPVKSFGLCLAAAGLSLMASIQVLSQDDTPKEIKTKKNPVTASDTVQSKAKSNYEEKCLMCHGETGKGDGPMAGMLKEKPPDMTDGKILSEMTDGDVYWLVTKGKKPMPPFENQLSDDERWGLVHLMRTLSNTKSNIKPKKN